MSSSVYIVVESDHDSWSLLGAFTTLEKALDEYDDVEWEESPNADQVCWGMTPIGWGYPSICEVELDPS